MGCRSMSNLPGASAGLLAASLEDGTGLMSCAGCLRWDLSQVLMADC